MRILKIAMILLSTIPLFFMTYLLSANRLALIPVFGIFSLLAIGFMPPEAIGSTIRCSPSLLGNEWSFKGTGHHQVWSDQRRLFVLYHPWEESQAGCSGSISQEIVIPDGCEDRLKIGFYMTDDYHDHHEKLGDDSWVGQISLVGHRFKQLLINDVVIWEKDVADPEGVSEPSHFAVLLPEEISAKSHVKIEFRLIDKVESSKRLDGDYRYIGTTDGIDESDPWKFMTHVYIGDIVLAPESLGRKKSKSPNAALAEKIHSERWPLEPYGENVDFPVSLSLEGTIPKSLANVPIRCGIPIPAGKVSDPGHITLSNKAGKCLPLQLSPMNSWTDGSLRWVEIDSIVNIDDLDKEGTLLLDIAANKSEVPLPKSPVSVVPGNDNTFIISTGAIQIDIGGTNGKLLSKMTCDNLAIEDLVGEVEIGGKIYTTITDSSEVLADGPVRGEVELSGKMRSGSDDIGRFVFRLSAVAGQSCVRMTWRIFNDGDKTLNISRFELIGQHQLIDESIFRWGNSEGKLDGGACIQQLVEDKFDVVDASGSVKDIGEIASGWLGIASDQGSMMMLVRHFQQQFPKAIKSNKDDFRISLFEPSEAQPQYGLTAGEAKRHEIFLGLWDEQLSVEKMEDTAQLCSNPALLFDAEYFCSSGGFGYAVPHNDQQFVELDEYMKKTYGEINDERFYKYGIRNWGDQPYGQAEANTWCNGYYDRMQGFASEYLMTGEPRWLDHLEATARHIMDIDVCHSAAKDPNLLGAIYACYAVNHTDGGSWAMMQRTKGMLAYWRFTGDIDARNTALGVADSAIRTNLGIGRTSVRDHAGILYCLMAAYDETNDAKYLDAAKKVAHDAIGRIDPRRGCYAEVHGNISYRGNVPWMVAQLAQPLYEYYRYSGDVDAAAAVVGLAESIVTENCTRDVLGDVYGYSHNPHFNKTSGYHILIAPAILYAYELTGNDIFLQHGLAMYAQTIREGSVNSINNCYWNTPTLLYYLRQYGK